MFNLLAEIIYKHGLSALNFTKEITEDSTQGKVGVMSLNDKIFEKYLNSTSVKKTKYAIDLFEDEIFFNGVEKNGKTYFTKSLKKSSVDFIYKIAIDTPYLCKHEFMVGKYLLRASKYLPNLVRPLSFHRNVKIHTESPNPFKVPENFSSKCAVEDVVLYEHVDHRLTLNDVISSGSKVDLKIQKSVVNQLLMSVLILQNKTQFVHNDLHFSNVLIREYTTNSILLYIFEYKNRVCYSLIKGYNLVPVIIDYGFTFVKEVAKNRLYIGAQHTHKGYANHCFDPVADFKCFISRLVYGTDIFTKEESQEIKKEFLNKLPIERCSGWDLNKDVSISKFVTKKIVNMTRKYLEKEVSKSSKYFFLQKEYEITDILCSFIVLPLREQKYENTQQVFSSFFKEWLKIEKWISYDGQKLFIFKSMVEKLFFVLSDDQCNLDESIDGIKNYIYKLFEKITNSTILLTKVDFKLMVSSLLELTRHLEGMMFEKHVQFIERKKREYTKISFKNAFELYGLIEKYLSPEDIVIKSTDNIIVMDSIEETSYKIKLNHSDLDIINNIPCNVKAINILRLGQQY